MKRESYLRKINTKSTHIHAVEKGAEVLVETTQAFIQELQVHHIGFQVSHTVAELSEGRLERVQWEVRVADRTAAAGSCLRCTEICA